METSVWCLSTLTHLHNLTEYYDQNNHFGAAGLHHVSLMKGRGQHALSKKRSRPQKKVNVVKHLCEDHDLWRSDWHGWRIHDSPFR